VFLATQLQLLALILRALFALLRFSSKEIKIKKLLLNKEMFEIGLEGF